MLFSNFWTHEDSWYRKLLEERITSSHKSCQSQQQAKDQKIETGCSAPVGGRKDRYLVDAAVCTGNFLLVVAPGHNAVLWPKFLVVGGWIQFLSTPNWSLQNVWVPCISSCTVSVLGNSSFVTCCFFLPLLQGRREGRIGCVPLK